jgi:heptosyltransferase-2
MTVSSKAKVTVGFHQNPFSYFFTDSLKHEIPYFLNGRYLHEVERNALVAKLAIKDLIFEEKNLKPKFFMDPRVSVSKYQHSPYVVMAPTSVWWTKQMSAGEWIKLIHKQDQELNIYLVGAPSDYAAIELIASEAKCARVVNLAGKTSLHETALLMKGSRRVFCNDSGPLHIASAVNAPTTAFFCSTTVKFGFGPLAEESEVFDKDLPCKPCGIHGKKACPEGHFNCSKLL